VSQWKQNALTHLITTKMEKKNKIKVIFNLILTAAILLIINIPKKNYFDSSLIDVIKKIIELM